MACHWERKRVIAVLYGGSSQCIVPTLSNLSQGWDGNLLLSSSSSQLQRHVVLGVDASGSKPRVLWGLSGTGAIAVDPTLTGRGLTIPGFEGEGAVNRFISNKDLPATRLDLGACL